MSLYYQGAAEKRAASRREEDRRLFKEYQENPSPQNLANLLDQLDGLIQAEVNKWSSARVPRAALVAEAESLAMDAIESYDSSQGASLATHVSNYLQKLYSFVAKTGSIDKIPENRYRRIREFNEAKRHLENKFNREPSAAELADYLKEDLKEIERFQKESYDSLTQATGLLGGLNEIEASNPQKRYAIEAVYYDLTPEEKVVYEYWQGRYGRPQVTRNKDIAAKTGMSESKVSRLRSKITKKIEDYLE